MRHVPHMRISRKTIGIVRTAEFRNFYIKKMRHSCQWNTSVTFMKSRYQRGKVIRTISMKIDENMYRKIIMIETEMPGQDT